MRTIDCQRTFSIFVLTTLVLVASSLGTVREVPAQFATIQAALDVSITADTICVAPGRYHEFLVCSTNTLMLTGWHSGDTLEEFRTILDPIPMGLDTPSVAVFSGDSIRINNFAFYNRPEMREPDWPTRVGGIRHTGLSLFVTNCLFDSVSRAIHADHCIKATHCVFRGCLWHCLYPSNEGVVYADNCSFEGSRWWLVYGTSGSTIRNCTFRRSEPGGTHLLQLHGRDIEVSGCTFGPSEHGFSILPIFPQGNCRISECVFEDISGTPTVIEISLDCPEAADTPIEVRNNIFRDCRGVVAYGGTNPIGLGCQSQNAGYLGVVRNNLFVDGTGIQTAPGVGIGGSVELYDNIFQNLVSNEYANVYATARPNDTIYARGNQFLLPGVGAHSAGAYFDASENWWGDSTGPFHPSLNPDGLGTEVGNGVIFEPWLTVHPDSADTNSNSIEQPVLLPNEYSLSAFPNPFNATTMLSIRVAKPGEYEVALYDVTGRETAKLFNGSIVAAHDVKINAETFATGIYFARLVGEERELAVVKLVLLK
ncbi:right-handed parallel beta-helix repeat-containing protein [bacterium]|nr:right-handed parallel beta-helix repeat-containing protein [bacterium]